MRLYIAGPMTGIRNHNFPVFWRAAIDLRSRGHTVQSPVEIDARLGFVFLRDGNGNIIRSDNPETYNFDMDNVRVVLSSRYSLAAVKRASFLAMLTCEAVAFLPGWQTSAGSMSERRVAKECGLKLFHYVYDDELGLSPMTDRWGKWERLARLYEEVKV